MKERDNSKNNDDKIICVNVFKSGESTTAKHEYTKIWIELINYTERGKSVSFCKFKYKNELSSVDKSSFLFVNKIMRQNFTPATLF